MGITPWSKGDLKPLWTFQLEPDSGTFDISGLTTSNFTLQFINTSNSASTNGTGTFSSLTAASGGNPASIAYQVSTADVATPGMFSLRVVVNAGSTQETFTFGIWECIT